MKAKMSCTKEVLGLLLGLLLITCNSEVASKRRVCVIGAGRAGLVALKTVAQRNSDFEVVAFERNSDVGGLWIYREDPQLDEHGLPAHSGIYQHLRTNIPSDFMLYRDYLVEYRDKDGRETVPHYMFLQYMRNYTDHFALRKYIELNTLVTKVLPDGSNGNWTRWRVQTKNLNTMQEKASYCDAVMVANGHFSKSYVPKIPGMETFEGHAVHSRAYRKAEHYEGKTVVVLGAGNSGIDIARALSHHANKVYLSHRHESIADMAQNLTKQVQEVRGVVSVNGNQFTLQDNSSISADAIIFCTGYEYDFPFLDESSGIVYDRKHVRPLYDQEINAVHPSMAFIGLDTDLFFGGTCQDQAEFFLDVLQGEEELPFDQVVRTDYKMW